MTIRLTFDEILLQPLNEIFVGVTGIHVSDSTIDLKNENLIRFISENKVLTGYDRQEVGQSASHGKHM